jgi:ESS family glutamate:Na+ symporter
MTLALITAAALLLIGFALRAGVKPLRWLHVPSSVIAGAVGWLALNAAQWANATPAWVPDVGAQFKAWPATLIAVVFAGLLMEKPERDESAARRARDVARQGIAAWIVILGQVLLGVLATWLLIKPFYGVPGIFGQLVEVGMAGGPGTARAMGEVYKSQGFEAGTDLGVFVAAFGLVYGVFSGIALVNLGVRRGWTSRKVAGPEFVSGLDVEHKPIGHARVRADVLDPLMLQVLLLAAAFGVGLLMQWGWTALCGRFDDPADKGQFVDYLSGLPLFIFTMFGGLIVREALHALGLGKLLDVPTLQRLSGVALELVIVASLTTISLAAITAYFWPVAMLLALGCAWCLFNLVWLSPRLLPKDYWFELGLMNYGFATATTPQSILLLKMVDRDLESGAAETYAAAVPLSAPFVGGGIVTFVGFPALIAAFGEWSVVAVCTVAIASLLIAGFRLARADRAGRAVPSPGTPGEG